MKKLLIIGAAVAMFANGSIAFAGDAYIESDGTTFVNSRWFMNPNGRIEIDFARTEDSKPSNWLYLFGATDRSGSSAIGTRVGMFINANGPYFVAGDAVDKWISPYTAPDTKRRIAAIDITAMKYCYYVKGATATSNNLNAAATVANTATYPVALFGNMNSTSGLSVDGTSCIPARIYRARFWTGNHLDHDYTPCVKGGVPGFIDAVDGAFVTAENPAALTASSETPEIADDGYVSTYGNNAANGSNLYIDTGYIVKDETKIELDFALADNYPGSGDWDMFASCKNKFNFYFNANGGNWCGPNEQWKAFSPAIARRTTDRGVRRKIVMDNSLYQVTFTTAGFTNAVGMSTVSSGTDYTTPASGTVANLRLASRVDASATKKSCAAPLKIYGLKIYEGETLVHNYVPYVKNGAAGLLDMEGNGGFISAGIEKLSLGSGGLIHSDAFSRDAYLESDATQAINTEYLVKGSKTRLECDFAYTDCTTNSTGTTGYQQRPFGQDSGGGLLYAFYVNGNGNFMFGFGNSFINTHGPGVAADTMRHTAVIDGYHDRLYYITGDVTNNTYDISGDAHSNDSTWPMGIFATPTQQDASAWRNPSKIRLYSMRIYEEDELKHEYLPFKNGATVGLYDTIDKVVKTDVRNGNAFGYGGMGVDGAERWLVTPQGGALAKSAGSMVLTANAVGAQSYRWTKNGEAIEGGTDGNLAVEWARGGNTDTYTVTPVYSVFGEEVEGAAVSATVLNVPQGLIISFK